MLKVLNFYLQPIFLDFLPEISAIRIDENHPATIKVITKEKNKESWMKSIFAEGPFPNFSRIGAA